MFEYDRAPKHEGFVHLEPRNDFQKPGALNEGHSLRCTWSMGAANAIRARSIRIFGDRATLTISDVHNVTVALERWASTPWHERPKEELRRFLAERFLLNPELPGDLEKLELYVTGGGTIPEVAEALWNYPVRPNPIAAIGSEDEAEVHQFQALSRHIRQGGTPRSNAMVGLAAVIAAASALKSFESGEPVDIDPALMEFDFETPSIVEYDVDAAPIPGSIEPL